jgi:hypothetical protein
MHLAKGTEKAAAAPIRTDRGGEECVVARGAFVLLALPLGTLLVSRERRAPSDRAAASLTSRGEGWQRYFKSQLSRRAVALLPRHSTHAAPTINLGVIGMFDVYVRGNSRLLVIRRGAPLPAGLVGGWRKKRAARSVSDEISGAVMREGFYKRSQARVMDAPVDVSQSF